ncbi:MAG TPA: Ldh family oxidoreductase [Gaiellaceae bacterium]|nr:Ldh family oxidoreductase [Gaiellaceae bacterium]
MLPEEADARLRALGLSAGAAAALAAHFEDAERRGKPGHGWSRIAWLERELREHVDPSARPERLVAEDAFERWHGRGALGYLTLDAAVRSSLERPPARARLVVCEATFPTGMLGHWVRRLADGGLVAVCTATSPRRLASPFGGPPLTGTNPLAIGIPSSDRRPVVVDVSPAQATWGDVLRGAATTGDVVPFGGDQAHKAFALAVGLQLLVDALTIEDDHGAVLLVARPESDPVPALRELAAGVRLPGDARESDSQADK